MCKVGCSSCMTINDHRGYRDTAPHATVYGRCTRRVHREDAHHAYQALGHLADFEEKATENIVIKQKKRIPTYFLLVSGCADGFQPDGSEMW